MMRKYTLSVLFLWLLQLTVIAQTSSIIKLSPDKGSDTKNMAAALQQAANNKNKPVTILLSPGIYHFDRSEAFEHIYYVSNTASEVEDPDPTKHIGIYLHSLKNITIDGTGSTLMMNGEMSAFVLDNCENITFKNFNIDNEAPTQTEVEVVENGKDYLIVNLHPTSHYRINDGKLEWFGQGWSFTEGIAQSYDRVTDTTWRSWSPMENLIQTTEIRPNILRLQYSEKPEVKVGTVFQIRDAIRDEVCGLVSQSKNIKFENINFYYLGNFGVVGQVSENITFNRCNFAPMPGSGRTNAGFADFIQISSCKGLVDITDSYFAGAHDDPINVHGTHLKVVKIISPSQLKVRYMHHQTFGFENFFKGNEVQLTDANSLLPIETAVVKTASLVSPREILLTLDKPLKSELSMATNIVVENLTLTPQIHIANCTFKRIPTRGLLISTRKRVLVENNTFYGMQMSGILIANDALSWYESGPVTDFTIRKNKFLYCGAPVINISPENKTNKGCVHKNITIEDNIFYLKENAFPAIHAKSVDGLVIRSNYILSPSLDKINESDYIEIENCDNVTISDNRIEFTK